MMSDGIELANFDDKFKCYENRCWSDDLGFIPYNSVTEISPHFLKTSFNYLPGNLEATLTIGFNSLPMGNNGEDNPDQKWTKLLTKPTLFIWRRKQKALINLCSVLTAKTRENRINIYLTQFKNEGFVFFRCEPSVKVRLDRNGILKSIKTGKEMSLPLALKNGEILGGIRIGNYYTPNGITILEQKRFFWKNIWEISLGYNGDIVPSLIVNLARKLPL
jgi:hypothetical protein